MRFLVDTCVGHKLAQWLRDKGHDVLESRDEGNDPGDIELLHRAVRERCVLITIDKDFGKLVFLNEEEHCGLIRLPDIPASQRPALLQKVIDKYEDELRDMCIITIRGDRIRISRDT